jgi:hypothetical protein
MDAIPAVVTEWAVQDSLGYFTFDLSVIPQTFCDDILAAFGSWGPDSITSLTLNCQRRHEYQSQLPQSGDAVEYPPNVLASIDGSRNSGRVIVALLTQLIPKSSVLTSLTLDWLDLSVPEAMEVIDLLPQCRSLRTLRLNAIVLCDDGLRRLLEVVPPDRLQNVEVRECEVTDGVLPDILKYIETGEVLSFIIDDMAWSAIEDAIGARIEQVRAHSGKLREAIAALRNLVRDDLGEDRTFAVGPGARQFNVSLENLLKSVTRLKERGARK